MIWLSKRRLCFVRVDQTYEPWHKRLSLPPCGPYLATSNISPNNKVNTRYNVQCSEKELFCTSCGHLRQIDKAVHMLTSSSKWRQEWLGGRKGPSVGSIAQLTIQKEAFSREKTRNALCSKQWREREMDRGFCEGRNHCGKETSSSCRDSDYARAQRYEYCWKCGSDNQQARTTFEEMLNAIGDSLSDLASSDHKQDGEDKEVDEDDTELSKLSDDDEPGWVIGTISKIVQHRMDSFRKKQMRLD